MHMPRPHRSNGYPCCKTGLWLPGPRPQTTHGVVPHGHAGLSAPPPTSYVAHAGERTTRLTHQFTPWLQPHKREHF